MEIMTSGKRDITDSIAGITLFNSSSAVILPLPGLVLWPQISRIFAPSTSIFSAVKIISSAFLRLPAKNESGVVLMIPITSGSLISINRPLQLKLNIKPCLLFLNG